MELKLLCLLIIFIECFVLYAVILDISWCNNICFYTSLFLIELFIVWEASNLFYQTKTDE